MKQTVRQAIREANKRNKETIAADTRSCFLVEVTRKGKTTQAVWRSNLTTDTASGYTNRRDFQSKAMGMGPSFTFATAVGFATATSGNTLTNSGAAFTTAGQALSGQIVVACPNSSGTGSKVYGVILSNTATVLTVDQWTDPASTSAAAGTTPNATCSYIILPGQNPASWMAVTANATAPSSADTTLTAEIVTSDFARAVGTYSHTAAATTYNLTHTYNSTTSVTISKEAIFGAQNSGSMPFESAEPTPPSLISGDSLQQSCTITIN